jgi:NADH:ubiquinone oxidoreductase subunit 6 (subunit J)
MALFGQFFYPFEVISLLLIAAMVGAVLLAKRSV